MLKVRPNRGGMLSMKTYSIALIPGDGIGKDVAEPAWQVLQN